MTGPERRAWSLARKRPWMRSRELAKKAGIRVELARQILAEVQAQREAK